MNADKAILDAVEAGLSGDKNRARQILSDLLNNDPMNARAWYLLSQVVDTKDRSIECLQRAGSRNLYLRWENTLEYQGKVWLLSLLRHPPQYYRVKNIQGHLLALPQPESKGWPHKKPSEVFPN